MTLKTINKQPRRTILLTRFSALGDVAMTVPVVYSACRCNPDIRFVMVTRPAMTSIFVNAPENLCLVGADVKNTYKGIGGLYKLCKELVDTYHPDYYIDLHNVLRTRIMAAFLRLNGIRCERIYKPRSQRRALTRKNNKVMLPLTLQRTYYNDAFVKSGLDFPETFNGLFDGRCKAPAETFSAITTQKENQLWVGVAPFAAHEGKIYPPEMMKQVVAMLQAQADAGMPMRVFLFGGGAHEQQILDAWVNEFSIATSLAGKRYGFAVELALLNHLNVMVSMDSANMHLAAIANTPTISIWGATHPYCGFKAWGQDDADSIQTPLECRPCSVFGNKPCLRGDRLCLNAIKPNRIFDRIMQHLNSSK